MLWFPFFCAELARSDNGMRPDRCLASWCGRRRHILLAWRCRAHGLCAPPRWAMTVALALGACGTFLHDATVLTCCTPFSTSLLDYLPPRCAGVLALPAAAMLYRLLLVPARLRSAAFQWGALCVRGVFAQARRATLHTTICSSLAAARAIPF